LFDDFYVVGRYLFHTAGKTRKEIKMNDDHKVGKTTDETCLNDEYVMFGMGGIANIMEKYLLERDGE
jgi:hypothetical protein